MQERIIEIIVFVISELKQNKQFSEIDIEKLHNEGYSSAEISAAFSWLADRMEFSSRLIEEEGESDSDSFRVLHDAESEMFTKEAWGELIQLQALGILTNENVESVIESAAMAGFNRMGASQLRRFVANQAFSAQDPGMHGSRFMLSGSDLIN